MFRHRFTTNPRRRRNQHPHIVTPSWRFAIFGKLDQGRRTHHCDLATVHFMRISQERMEHTVHSFLRTDIP